VHPDVGVQIHDPVVALGEEAVERPGLHRGVQLKDGVAEAERLRPRQSQVRRLDDAEPLGGGVERPVHAVDEDDEAVPLRLRGGDRIHEGPREVEIVLRADRADGCSV
jgi:hypothetical protein